MSELAHMSWYRRLNWTGLAVPILMALILGMMVLPMPPFLLDVLFTFNIAVSILVLLAAVNTVKPLEFAAFPIVLLLTTLLRLSLNVASARIVLLEGHTGPGAAGKVIEAFGQVLVGGNFAVGLVVFVILVVINFVVITKGAGRIAEVSARFTLDAMPGKQMAIDADLNAGLIGEAEARKRRTEISQQAEFYGAMDGASKFVRGDAIAGILILLVNIIGGFAIGVLQHNLSPSLAVNHYVLLAIGDGLVAQVPALVISMAAGLIVSRVGDEKNIGEQMIEQLFARPHALTILGGVLGVVGLMPGMPHMVFLGFAAVCALGGYWMRRHARLGAEAEVRPVPVTPDASQEASWDDLVPVDVLALEVGYRLIPLVDRVQDGELLKRIKGIRKKFAQEIGFLPPSVHIRDNLELKPNAYRILVNGVAIGEGEAVPGMFLAINPGNASSSLPGAMTKDPAFGLPAVWIEGGLRGQAQIGGHTVVDASTVVATHLNTLMQRHASMLLGRQEVQSLLDHFGKFSGKLIEETVPKIVSLPIVQKVLQHLLDEGVPVRDLRSILEAIAENATRTQDPGELCTRVRCVLGASIVQTLFGGAAELPVMVLEPTLEKIVHQAIGGGAGLGLEPGLADSLLRDTQNATRRNEAMGQPAVLLAPDSLRWPLARLLRRSLPQLRVLAHGEIPDTRSIRVTSVVGAPA